MIHPFDEQHMAQALALAEHGLFTTMPNPRVGCVIVAPDGKRVIGEGWTQPAGHNHAEIEALNDAAQRGRDVRGATVYVTLEPCSHFGRTPPCCDALIRAGVARVVVATGDPNPKVAGAGVARLRAAGIQVDVGVRAAEARAINEGFMSRMERGRPWLRIKSAASLDGRTALANGQSQWITSEEARADAQQWRARSCAILTGIGTVLADNPRLTVRGLKIIRQPLRVIVDSQLRTPLDAAVLDQGRALIATAQTEPARFRPYEDKGVTVLSLPTATGEVDLPALMHALGQRDINEVMTEAGAQLNGALIASGCADALLLYLAPCLLGDAARGMFALPELASLDQRYRLRVQSLRPIGDDLRVLAQFIYA